MERESLRISHMPGNKRRMARAKAIVELRAESN
jgi:hypothetical protein